MKRLITFAIASMLMLSVAASAEDRDPKTRRGQRFENQQKRIKDGVKDGSLTKKETVKLEVKEGKLAREARHDRIDGGGMTAREKAKIEIKQDKLSRDIAKEKHDAQTKK